MILDFEDGLFTRFFSGSVFAYGLFLGGGFHDLCNTCIFDLQEQEDPRSASWPDYYIEQIDMMNCVSEAILTSPVLDIVCLIFNVTFNDIRLCGAQW